MDSINKLVDIFTSIGFSIIESSDVKLVVNRNIGETFIQELTFFGDYSSNKDISANVRVYINLPIYAELVGKQYYADGITCEFGQNGITPLGWHTVKKWRFGCLDAICDSVTNVALPWLDNLSTVDGMIEFLEEKLRNGVHSKPSKSTIDFFEKFIFRQSKPDTRGVVRPPIYNEYLANLYYIKGDYENSKKYMARWVDLNKKMPWLADVYVKKLAELNK